jgi:chemotaxis protein MotB
LPGREGHSGGGWITTLMPMPPIIIIKKKSGHGGHHGGAWKVAYADFVTAMMALFIVLWLMSSSSKEEKIAISGYFKDPDGIAKKVGTGMVGTGENLQLTKEDMPSLKAELQKSIQKMSDLDKLKKNIEMTVTAEGLRIELLESEKGTFFDSGSSRLNQSGQEMLVLLAAELGKVPNHVSVEGHTDSKPFAGKGNYSNWELSADRANAARRLMQQSGLAGDQISQVRGFADQRLRNAKDPQDPSNRRVSIIVQYINNTADAADDLMEGAKEVEEKAGEGKPSAAGAKAESKEAAKKPEGSSKKE